MKKIFIIICILLEQIAFCSVNDSNNSFEIELKEVPSGNTKNITKSNGGLSNGAVTAITLGSVFGGLGALSGIGYYFLKHSKGLACGFACGEKCPYQLVSIKNSDFITKSNHTYLIKAYEYALKNNNYKYLIIPDTQIKPNTYNTVFFEIPENFTETDFKIIQSSAPLLMQNNISELDTNILLNDKNAVTKISTSTDNFDLSKGILIKQGKISAKENNIFAVTTSYKPSSKRGTSKTYAIIIVFEKR